MALSVADLLQQSPNYVNPDYATPGQVAQARKYGEFLMGKDNQIPVHSWQAGLANALSSGFGAYQQAHAGQLEREGMQSGAGQMTPLIAALMGQGGQGAPQGPQGGPMAAASSAGPPDAPQPTASAFAPTDGPSPKFDATNPTGGIFGGMGYKPDGWEGPAAPSFADRFSGAGPSASPQPPAPVPQGGPPVQVAQAQPQQMNDAGPGMGGGGSMGSRMSPAMIAQALQNPWVPKESKELLLGLINPKPYEDVYGKPGIISPANGARALPVTGLQPGVRAPISVGDVGTTQVITPPGAPAPAPTSSVPGFSGGGGQSAIDALAAKGRELAAAKTLTQGGATAQAEGNQDDIKAATAAPAVMKGLGLIKSTIQTSPGITFGPTAGMSAELKRVVANYAPGLSDEKSLAGADAIEKLNFGLASQLAKTVGGTQGELFKAISSTPGTEKSKQGTLALIDMMQQDQTKAQKLGELYRKYEASNNLQAYPQARQDFLNSHPIINPLSGKPVEMDIEAARKGSADKDGGWITAPNGARIRERK